MSDESNIRDITFRMGDFKCVVRDVPHRGDTISFLDARKVEWIVALSMISSRVSAGPAFRFIRKAGSVRISEAAELLRMRREVLESWEKGECLEMLGGVVPSLPWACVALIAEKRISQNLKLAGGESIYLTDLELLLRSLAKNKEEGHQGRIETERNFSDYILVEEE